MRLHDYIDYYAREYHDADFAIAGGKHTSYREAGDEINRLSNAFSSAGLHAGDRMAMLSKNSLEYMILYYAASKAGVVPVPMNYRLAPLE